MTKSKSIQTKTAQARLAPKKSPGAAKVVKRDSATGLKNMAQDIRVDVHSNRRKDPASLSMSLEEDFDK